MRSCQRTLSFFSMTRRLLSSRPWSPPVRQQRRRAPLPTSSRRCCTSLAPLHRTSLAGISSLPLNRRSTLFSSTAAATEQIHQQEEESIAEKFVTARRTGVRNVAVIAHVDHGKTTLVDQLLHAAKDASGAASLERLLDSGALEKERGITITGKVTRIVHGDTVINCADTPGHSDFSGEVDRFLSLSDGFVLVVDAAEGPKSQTKYVLSRALALGLTPLVVLNKCDRPEAAAKIDSGETESKLMDLFHALGATDEQMSYLTLYASAREGWVTDCPVTAMDLAEAGYDGEVAYSMKGLLDRIVEQVPEPTVRVFADVDTRDEAHDGTFYADDKLSLAAVTVGNDQYLGRTCTGRIVSGSVGMNDSVAVLKRISGGEASERKPDVSPPENISGVFIHEGISRMPLEGRAYAGDIVTLAGVPETISVGDTVTGSENPVELPIKTPQLAPPTLCMDFGANDGPLAGKEGTMVASSKIRDRLFAETDNNVTLTVEPSQVDSEKTVVYARGELQLGILIEEMRREGFELLISPPRIVTRTCPETGNILEPYEEVTVDVDSEYSGTVISALTGARRGVLMEMSENSADGKCQLVFEVPSRGLLGFSSDIATSTKGSAVVNHLYLTDRKQESLGTDLMKGKLVSNESGKATSYALSSLSARGTLFIKPGDVVYPGMVIGENAKQGDLEVNPVRAKDKSNVRSVNKDEKISVAPPKLMSVEDLIGYMEPDEVIEITPKSVRLRKQLLDSSARERAARQKAKLLRAQKEK